MEIAEERAVPAGERKPRHRGGDSDVDADHAGVEMLLELPSGPAAAGEDGEAAAAVHALAADGERRFAKIAGIEWTESTGPKISSRATRMAGLTWSSTLGPITKPFPAV